MAPSLPFMRQEEPALVSPCTHIPLPALARRLRVSQSIGCDNDLANGSSRFKEIVGGSHRFGS